MLTRTKRCGNFDRYPSLLKAYILENEKRPYLEINNMVPYDLEIKGIEWFDPKNEIAVSIEGSETDFYPIVLKATQYRKLPKIYKIPLVNDLREIGYQIRLWTNVRGNNTHGPVFAENVKYSAPLQKRPQVFESVKRQLRHHPFLQFNSERKEISIKPGIWRLKGSLVVPEEYH